MVRVSARMSVFVTNVNVNVNGPSISEVTWDVFLNAAGSPGQVSTASV